MLMWEIGVDGFKNICIWLWKLKNILCICFYLRLWEFLALWRN